MLKRVIAAGAVALILACSKDQSAVDAVAPPAELAMAKTETASQSLASQPAPADRKVIRTAELRVELDDIGAALHAADSIAAAVRGIVASTRQSQGERGYAEASLTVRVPADRFAEALASLRALGRVRLESTNAEDVTRNYADLEIRLAVKRDMVARLRALLANRNARLSDLVQVERELGRAVTELEQMEGERRYLDNQIAMSTISATFYHAPAAGPGGFVDPVVVALREALVILGRSVAMVISVAVFMLPWLLVAVPVWVIVRARRRAAQ